MTDLTTLEPAQLVKATVYFTNGPYKGMQGRIMKACDTCCSLVLLALPPIPGEVVEDYRNMCLLNEWLAAHPLITGSPAAPKS